MCSAERWDAVLDKYHLRKVQEVRVRCWYKNRGCRWEGEINDLGGHAGTCENQWWECEYCGLKCNFEEGEGQHWPVCLKFPQPCPNGCEVGSVERCGMEQHHSVCSLEPVACEMKEFGCSVVLPRKELVTHMRQSELQHLTAMTALNLRLTRQLQQDSAERDRKFEKLQQEMAHQKEEITALQAIDCTISAAVARMECEVIGNISEQQRLLRTVSADVSEQKSQIEKLNNESSYISSSMDKYIVREVLAGIVSCSGTEVFTFDDYAHFKCGGKMFSAPFYTHQHGYKLRLLICYYADDIGASLCLMKGESDNRLLWPVSIRVRLSVLNQRGDFRHVMKGETCTWGKMEIGEEREIDANLMKYATLERQLDSIQFMVNDCLSFKVTVTVL